MVVDCHHSLCLYGDRMKMSLFHNFFLIFFKETPTSPWVPFTLGQNLDSRATFLALVTPKLISWFYISIITSKPGLTGHLALYFSLFLCNLFHYNVCQCSPCRWILGHKLGQRFFIIFFYGLKKYAATC